MLQVLSKALQVWSITVIPLESPDVKDARAEPQNEQAFICNLQVQQAAQLSAHTAVHDAPCSTPRTTAAHA